MDQGAKADLRETLPALRQFTLVQFLPPMSSLDLDSVSTIIQPLFLTTYTLPWIQQSRLLCSLKATLSIQPICHTSPTTNLTMPEGPFPQGAQSRLAETTSTSTTAALQEH